MCTYVCMSLAFFKDSREYTLKKAQEFLRINYEESSLLKRAPAGLAARF